jgi:hypothetical protein
LRFVMRAIEDMQAVVPGAECGVMLSSNLSSK